MAAFDRDEQLPEPPVTIRKRAKRRWPCFLVGFLIAFVVISITVKRFYMLPSGDAVVRAPLWQYYLVEIPRLFEFGPRNLGLAPDMTSHTLMILLMHLGCSLGGGFIGLGICWVLDKVKGQSA
jgi:hypothetical protein